MRVLAYIHRDEPDNKNTLNMDRWEWCEVVGVEFYPRDSSPEFEFDWDGSASDCGSETMTLRRPNGEIKRGILVEGIKFTYEGFVDRLSEQARERWYLMRREGYMIPGESDARAHDE